MCRRKTVFNVAQLESGINALENENTSLIHQLKELRTSIDMKMKKINDLILCRYCGEPFNTYLEGYNSQLVTVQCAKYRMRHKYSC